MKCPQFAGAEVGGLDEVKQKTLKRLWSGPSKTPEASSLEWEYDPQKASCSTDLRDAEKRCWLEQLPQKAKQIS